MRRSGRHLIILNYHHASGGDLGRHLRYLNRHYRMMHLEEALEELYAEKKKVMHDQRTPLVLTFDDGYYDNYTHAFKLACQLRVPITIFLIPGYVESGDYFWWGEGRRLVKRAQVDNVTFDEKTYHLQQPHDRLQLTQTIDKRLRHVGSVEEREIFLAKVRQMLAVPTSVTEEEEKDRPFSWKEIREMQQSGWVSFGAHTMHHPILSYLTDPAEVLYEVRECRTVLEQHLGQEVRVFAYPVGRWEHIGDEAVQAVQEAGYKWAVTTMCNSATPQSDPYRLERQLGDVSRHWLVMAAETSGIWKMLSPLWKRVVGS